MQLIFAFLDVLFMSSLGVPVSDTLFVFAVRKPLWMCHVQQPHCAAWVQHCVGAANRLVAGFRKISGRQDAARLLDRNFLRAGSARHHQYVHRRMPQEEA